MNELIAALKRRIQHHLQMAVRLYYAGQRRLSVAAQRFAMNLRIRLASLRGAV
jgi:hypothetical protein